jgi:hypothetical protein
MANLCAFADMSGAAILISGHYGSKTSSRSTFLDAVGAKLFIVSSGPTRYSSVTLPDPEVIAEYENRRQVFRTDIDDDQCAVAEDKIGPDNDERPGGCSIVLVSLPATGPIVADYQQAGD